MAALGSRQRYSRTDEVSEFCLNPPKQFSHLLLPPFQRTCLPWSLHHPLRAARQCDDVTDGIKLVPGVHGGCQGDVDHAQNHKDKRLGSPIPVSQDAKRNRYHSFARSVKTPITVVSHDVAKETQGQGDRPYLLRATSSIIKKKMIRRQDRHENQLREESSSLGRLS